MPEPALFRDLAFVLLAAVAGGLLAHFLRLPLFLGYIVGGAFVGPFTPGPRLSEPGVISLLSEVGVVLLMFTMGLEFSLRELRRVRGVALLGGLLGMGAVVALFVSIRGLAGFSINEAVFLGSALSVSSTMVVVKLLEERQELNSPHGRIMIGTLLVEDLAVVVLLVLLPSLGTADGPGPVSAGALGLALLKGLAILGPVLVLATRAVPRVMERVARAQDFELFLLVTLTLSVGTAVMTSRLGLSPAMGAFLAGLLIGESDYVPETLARILPLRDLFVAVFFVSTGMLVDPAIVGRHLPLLLGLVVFVVVAKGFVRGGIAALFRQPPRVVFLVALGFTQVGEFTFVLARSGEQLGLISFEHYNVVLAAGFTTIFASTLLFRSAPRLWSATAARFLPVRPDDGGAGIGPAGDVAMTGHVILCGYGRVGSLVGEALERFGVPCAVIETDPSIVARLRERGLSPVYGDSSSDLVCRRAHPEGAALAVVALRGFLQARQTLRNLRHLNPRLPVIVRAHWDAEREEFFRDGASEVVQPEFEGSLEIIRSALGRVGTPPAKTADWLRTMEQERSGALVRRWLEDEDPHHAVQTVHEVTVAEGSPFAGRSIGEAGVRQKTGASIVKVLRPDGTIHSNPPAGLVLRPGDRLLLMGSLEEIVEFMGANEPRAE